MTLLFKCFLVTSNFVHTLACDEMMEMTHYNCVNQLIGHLFKYELLRPTSATIISMT